MARHISIHPFEIDTLARTRVTMPTGSPAMQLGNATLHLLWHGWQAGRRVAGELALAFHVARERRALGRLDDHQLRDIGLDRATALHEAGRGFLDLPGARHR